MESFNSCNIKLNYDKKLSLSWHDIKFGVDNFYFDPKVAIEYARDVLELSEATPPFVLELACLYADDPVYPYLDKIITSLPPQDYTLSQEKFLYMSLEWLFENKANFNDPTDLLEQIYADYGYPECMFNFFANMTTDREKNYAKIMREWEQYLQKGKSIFNY